MSRRRLAVVLAVAALLLLAAGLNVRRRRPAPDGIAPRVELASRPVAPASDVNTPSTGRPLSLFAQEGAPPRRVAGRVLSGGAPLPGAQVVIAGTLSAAVPVGPGDVVRTGPSGTFDFGLRSAERFTVYAVADAKAPAWHDLDLRDPTADPPPDRLEITLSDCGALVSGVVSDTAGGVIVGARIGAGENDVPGIGVSSDAQGRYTLCLPRGRVPVRVSAAGYGTLLVTLSVLGAMHEDFSLAPEAVITGQVVREDDGTPVASAGVHLSPADQGTRQSARIAVITDDAGRFRIADVAGGRHVINAGAEGLALPGPLDVQAIPGRVLPDLVLRLRALVRITGVVVGGDGRPIAGVSLSAGTTSRRSELVVSQADGRFVMRRAPRGRLQFFAEGYEVVAPHHVVADRGGDHVRVEVASRAAISGRVLRNGHPAARARIVMWAGRDDLRADEQGRYLLRDLRPGTYRVHAVSEDEEASGQSAEMVLGRGETREGVDISMTRGAIVSGVVVDERDRPVPEVYVQLQGLRRHDGGGATTDSRGAFTITRLDGGDEYRPRVLPSARSEAPLPPADGEHATIALLDAGSRVDGVRLRVRRARGSIAGRVLDAQGGPIADALVVATNDPTADTERSLWSFYNSWAELPPAHSRADGGFNIGELAPGRYTVRARAPDGAEAQVEDVSTGRTDVVLRLAAAGGIDGELVAFRFPPDVVVVQVGHPQARYRPELDGSRFHVRGLPVATYIVNAFNADEGDSARVEVRAGAVATATLRSRGSASVEGRVFDFRSGAPVDGMTCQAALRNGRDHAARLLPEESITDAQGRFTLDPVPAGDLYIHCWGPRQCSNGYAPVLVSPGGRVTTEVPVVKRKGQAQLELGAVFDPTQALSASVLRVVPGSPADAADLRPGDRVLAVDGAAVDRVGMVGVELLIRERDPGLVRLAMARADGTVYAAEVTLAGQQGH